MRLGLSLGVVGNPQLEKIGNRASSSTYYSPGNTKHQFLMLKPQDVTLPILKSPFTGLEDPEPNRNLEKGSTALAQARCPAQGRPRLAATGDPGSLESRKGGAQWPRGMSRCRSRSLFLAPQLSP